jgi:hypothetical protein
MSKGGDSLTRSGTKFPLNDVVYVHVFFVITEQLHNTVSIT